MEGNRKSHGRTLQRRYACTRLEEQLWTAAYEQIWPIFRRSLQRATEQAQRGTQRSEGKTKMARRA